MKHLSRREREGPAPKAWEGEGLGTYPERFLTPHPPRLRLGPSLSRRERCVSNRFAQPVDDLGHDDPHRLGVQAHIDDFAFRQRVRQAFDL